MRLIDADALLSDRMKTKFYHLPNGDVAIPLIDIEHAPTIGGWVSVKDRLPGIDENVLIFSKRYGIQKGYYDMNVWHVSGWGVMDGPTTHWMPLPKSPKETFDNEI